VLKVAQIFFWVNLVYKSGQKAGFLLYFSDFFSKKMQMRPKPLKLDIPFGSQKLEL
jgi:hypothetical protein